MKKFRILLALLMILMVASGANAATKLFDVKNTTGDSIYIDQLGQFVGYRRLIEVQTTNDTITKAESGTVFLSNISSGTLTYTLPVAREGVTYTFTTIDGGGSNTAGATIIDPSSTGTLVGCVNSAALTTFAVGNSLSSTGSTGDSVTIVGGDGDVWYCTDRVGTWTDSD